MQWLADDLMVVSADGGSSVSVDLRRVPQDEYAGLTGGDWVTVIGVVRNGNRRVIGTSILRGESQAPGIREPDTGLLGLSLLGGGTLAWVAYRLARRRHHSERFEPRRDLASGPGPGGRRESTRPLFAVAVAAVTVLPDSAGISTKEAAR